MAGAIGKDLCFDRVCNQVAHDLPPGWNLNVELENGAGSIELLDDLGIAHTFDAHDQSLALAVKDALEFAITQHNNQKE